MTTDFPSDPSSKILLLLLKKGNVKKTDLLPIATMHTVEKILPELTKNELITIKEEFLGRRTYEISLTPKGRAVAEQLKRAEEAARGEPIIQVSDQEARDWAKKFKEATKGMSLMYHVNVYQDHITIGQEIEGKLRISNVYVRVNGKGIMRLYCEEDESFECIHVQYAWTLPKVQEMYANNVKNGNVTGK